MPVQSLTKCIRSMFTLHNDLLNIWTHLIPGLYFLYLALASDAEMAKLDINLEDRIVFTGYLICATITMLMSAGYHTFRAHSHDAYNFCLACDLRGIVLLVSGANMLTISQALKYFDYWRHFYNLLNASMLLALLLWIPYMVKHRLSNQRTVYFSVFSFVAIIAWLHRFTLLADHHHLLPRIYNYVDHYESGWHHFNVIVICYVMPAVGLVIRNLKYPERKFPYIFDIFGASHQIFHVITAGGAYLNYSTLIELVRNGAFPTRQ
jgi:adiponectin receptor